MSAEKRIEKRNLSLEEFKTTPSPEAWVALQKLDPAVIDLLGQCKSFSDCHTKVREKTGLWIEDLAPVFQKLDACLAVAR